ncbi:unnamed protein product [Lactuca saligna]|uniref:Protein EXORDIUM-like 3 n=1 Tax=Lactuca saligna TaxID=75948 RepID=A0AA35Y0K1_LACSI|nr:unnamed protein product [Lactuca saligna]
MYLCHFSSTTLLKKLSGNRRSMAPSLHTLSLLFFFFFFFCFLRLSTAWRPLPRMKNNVTELEFGGYKKYEGSSEFVKLKYHMGPVLTSNITVHIIWYGAWPSAQKRIIREFINSISAAADHRSPSVSGWWKTVQLYTDQTGSNITRSVRLGQEKNDRLLSHGKTLTRLSIQSVIKSAVTAKTKPLPIHPKGGVYLLLTADDVYVEDFCKKCMCAYPFSVPDYIPGLKPLKSPNGEAAIDGMISVIAHEIAEVASNPLANAWYAGEDPSFPVEIADLCEGIYGTGGGGSYTGQMLNDEDGATYNMHGIRRRFLVQWVWNHVVNYCTGPNALD